MSPLFTYSLGIFLGIQMGKELNPNYTYLLHKYNKFNSEYYKNYQMDYHFNK
jgi:hypothetical protein